MAYGASREDLVQFLKREVERGRAPINTGLSRMASVRKVLSVLSDQEAADISDLDVGEVTRRFFARSEHQYSLASQVSYRSRLSSALKDFVADRLSAQKQDASDGQPSPKRPRESAATPPSHSIQIPLSRGWTVVIDRLPIDLTETEARRIGNVVLAYAMGDGT